MLETFSQIQLKAITYPIMSDLIATVEDLSSIKADEDDAENTAIKLLDWIEVFDATHHFAHSVIHGFVSQFGYSVIEGFTPENSYSDTEGGDYTCSHSSDASSSSSNSENVPLEQSNTGSF